MRQDANCTEDVADNLGLVGEVGGVCHNHFCPGLKLHMFHARHRRLDPNGLVALVQDLIHIGVKHVGAAVDGGEASKTLRQFAETIERVDVRRLSVTGNRVSVEANALDNLGSLSLGRHVVVGEIECHGMADKIPGSSLETEFVVDFLHNAVVHVKTWISSQLLGAGDQMHQAEQTLVRRRVIGLECANPFDERLHAALLENAHERRSESLHGVRRHLGHGGLVAGALLDVASGDLLELEVSGDVGGHEDVGELARGHEELGDEVDVPVVQSAVLLPRLRASCIVAMLLEELLLRRQTHHREHSESCWVFTVSRFTEAASL